MYVCVCNSVTESDIHEAVSQGSSSMKDLQQNLDVASCCGRCANCARSSLHQALSQRLTGSVVSQ